MCIIPLLFCALEIITTNNRKEINNIVITLQKRKRKGKKILNDIKINIPSFRLWSK